MDPGTTVVPVNSHMVVRNITHLYILLVGQLLALVN